MLRNIIISILILSTVQISGPAHAAECSTSSGSTCKLTCSEGTASLVCSDESSACEASCSDSSGNFEFNVLRALQSVSDGRISDWEAREIFDDLSRGQNLVGPFTIIIEP